MESVIDIVCNIDNFQKDPVFDIFTEYIFHTENILQIPN